MNRAQRHELILGLIEATGRVQVNDISSRAHVSTMTVRRDLETLEDSGVLTRVHGGAITTQSRSFEPGYHVRSMRRQAAKEAIGKAAAELIHDGQTVIIDAGSTAVCVAEALKGRANLGVLTFSLRVADVLADEPGIRVMITGGTIRPHERSLTGAMAEHAFRDLYFDTLILTAGGIDLNAGVTEYDVSDAEVKRAALASARRTILVADGSKLGAVRFARVCGIEQIDTLVTDPSARQSQQLTDLEATEIGVLITDEPKDASDTDRNPGVAA